MYTLDSMDGTECFDSKDAVLTELGRTAAQDYIDKVAVWMDSTEKTLEIWNGPQDDDDNLEVWTKA